MLSIPHLDFATKISLHTPSNPIATLEEPAELDIVDRCLGLLLRDGVKDLVIEIANLSDVPKYRLPNILLYVSVLESLTVCVCEMPSSLMHDAVRFRSLIYLELKCVHVEDEVITCLATSCPLLQVFFIITCYGFETFCVYGHQNLQKVWIQYGTPVERIDIEAPNLSCLLIIDQDRRGAPQMNLVSCKNLTTVIYSGDPLPNSNGFNDFLSNFPFTENFCLVTTFECNNLKFSSHSLRRLMLDSICDFEEIEFSTPNLVSFCFPCVRIELLSKVMDKRNLKACLQCCPKDCIDTLWFEKLRLFLYKKSGFKVLNLYIHAIYSQKFTELERLKAIELPPYELEHVELQLESHEESHIVFVEAALWCCRPRSLTLRSSYPLTDFDEETDIVKFTYKKLLQQDQGHTNIQIVPPSSSFLMALSGEGKAVSFVKEEVLQDEADNQRFAGLELV